MTFLGFALASGFFLLSLAFLMSMVRLIRGPTLPDRVVALDLIGVIALAFVALVTIQTGQAVYLDVAIVLGLISSVGTIAFARYLERQASS